MKNLVFIALLIASTNALGVCWKWQIGRSCRSDKDCCQETGWKCNPCDHECSLGRHNWIRPAAGHCVKDCMTKRDLAWYMQKALTNNKCEAAVRSPAVVICGATALKKAWGKTASCVKNINTMAGPMCNAYRLTGNKDQALAHGLKALDSNCHRYLRDYRGKELGVEETLDLDAYWNHDASKCMEDNGAGMKLDGDCTDCSNLPRQACADGYLMSSQKASNGCTRITCRPQAKLYGSCYRSGKTMKQRDAACAGSLLCARSGFDNRSFGGCTKDRNGNLVAGPPFEHHCCSYDETPDASKCMEDNGSGMKLDRDCTDCSNPPRQACADGYVMSSRKARYCTRITCTPPEGLNGVCWDSSKTLAQRDDSCADGLVCARRGYDNRSFGGCTTHRDGYLVAGPPFDHHCCTPDAKSRRLEEGEGMQALQRGELDDFELEDMVIEEDAEDELVTEFNGGEGLPGDVPEPLSEIMSHIETFEQLCEFAVNEEALDVPCETINELLYQQHILSDDLAERMLDVCLGTDILLRDLCTPSGTMGEAQK